MKKSYRLLIHMVRGKTVCDCDPMSTCSSAQEVHTDVRSWEELTQLLEDTPHMDAAIIRMDTLVIKLKGE